MTKVISFLRAKHLESMAFVYRLAFDQIFDMIFAMSCCLGVARYIAWIVDYIYTVSVLTRGVQYLVWLLA